MSNTPQEKPTSRPSSNSTHRAKRCQEVPLQLGVDEVELAAGNKDGPITRDTIIERAKRWADHPVPYSQSAYKDGYRTDCSGYVSMAWNLSTSRVTSTLVEICRHTPISKDDLLPGDALIYNNPNDPVNGSHAVIFAGWANTSHIHYQTLPLRQRHRQRPSDQTANAAGWLMLLTDPAVS